MLEAALEAGFSAAGVRRTADRARCPRRAWPISTRALRLAAGVVICASHNPYYDNGIKFFSADGRQAGGRRGARRSRPQLEEPMACVRSERARQAHAASPMRRAATSNSARARFRPSWTCTGCKLVVDCAHGAAYHIAPHVFHELGAEVISIGIQPDGLQHQRRLRRHRAGKADASPCGRIGAHLGMALDGDADRLQVVDAAMAGSTTATNCCT